MRVCLKQPSSGVSSAEEIIVNLKRSQPIIFLLFYIYVRLVADESTDGGSNLSKVKLDVERIKHQLETVANRYNSGEKGYTRLAFSKEEDQVIEWVAQELETYGARVRTDSVGNLYGTIGPDNAPVIAFGSHVDTVKNGGLFDGALGVFVGLECIRVLRDQMDNAEVAFELVIFKGEEGNPLGGTFGSRVVTGQVDPDEFDDSLLDSLGVSKEEIRRAVGTLPEYKAFLELHIEQGTVLEENDNKTGIVTNIAGISRSNIKVLGTPGHSGTMPMNSRDDALVHASEIVLHIHQAVKKYTDGSVRGVLKEAASELNLPVMELVSGANHDANTLTRHTEVGMLFVPSIKGISHNPEEDSDWAYIGNAAEIMLEALLKYKK